MIELSNSQMQDIKLQMIQDDPKRLNSKFRAKKLPYDCLTIELNEIEGYEQDGWEKISQTKRKAKVQKKKECGRKLEDDIWCMFYNLGFKILNLDEKLVVPWGPNKTEHKQLDVVAVGDEAIFVVECKASEKPKSNYSFKTDIESLINYKDGVAHSLHQVYGFDKKVKFLFATRNYNIGEGSEDRKRLKENDIYPFDENSYSYVNSLIKSYKQSVVYQFYGLMFKNQLINDKPLRVPALRGRMGKHEYYMMSIEPAKLLKIGFVLHRTKVNDSMAPTYQRMLVPSRLKGISKFIEEGGYFPNTVIVNFDKVGEQELDFVPYGQEDSQLGELIIPNAYGSAFIIDGQHRVYGYASTPQKDTNTIPVVAFRGLESEEQLKIFMDINQNQKAVSPSLRLDLEQDINWDSPRVDSRMRALRSSIIRELTYAYPSSALYKKISTGEDKSELTFDPFMNALIKSSLLPKANQKSFTANTDVCIYNCNNQDNDAEMKDTRKRISMLITKCYNYLRENTQEDTYNTFILTNRGTYGTITLISSIHEFLVRKGCLQTKASTDTQMKEISPFLNTFIQYLENMPSEDKTILSISKGQGAENDWMYRFQNCIHKNTPEFQPEGLLPWLEKQDKGLQEAAKMYCEQIMINLRQKVFEKLEDLYGDTWENQIKSIKGKCLQRMGDDNESSQDWISYTNEQDFKEIIEKYWFAPKEDDDSFVTFEKAFTISLDDKKHTARKDNLKWLYNFISYQKALTGAKNKPLSKLQVGELEYISQSLQPVE